MIENHINRTLLRKKISELFHYRLLPSLFEYGKNNEKEFIGSLKEKLFALQEAIYFLDAHLEAHWDLNEETMAWHWQHIIQSLKINNNNPTDFHHSL